MKRPDGDQAGSRSGTLSSVMTVVALVRQVDHPDVRPRLEDTAEDEPLAIGRPASRGMHHRLDAVPGDLLRVAAVAVCHPDAARPGPGGVEREPIAVGRPGGIERLLDEQLLRARRHIERPDVTAVGIPAEHVARLELAGGKAGADEGEVLSVGRPRGLDVVLRLGGELALGAGGEILHEQLLEAADFLREGELLPVGRPGGPFLHALVEGELHELAWRAAAVVHRRQCARDRHGQAPGDGGSTKCEEAVEHRTGKAGVRTAAGAGTGTLIVGAGRGPLV